MPHYRIRYSTDESGTFTYPDTVAGVEWTSSFYHPEEELMIGETEAELEEDGEEVVRLDESEAKRTIEELRVRVSKAAQPDANPAGLPPRDASAT